MTHPQQKAILRATLNMFARFFVWRCKRASLAGDQLDRGRVPNYSFGTVIRLCATTGVGHRVDRALCPSLLFILNCGTLGSDSSVISAKPWGSTDRQLSRPRNDLYCVQWGVKLYSLTRPATFPIHLGTTTIPGDTGTELSAADSTVGLHSFQIDISHHYNEGKVENIVTTVTKVLFQFLWGGGRPTSPDTPIDTTGF